MAQTGHSGRGPSRRKGAMTSGPRNNDFLTFVEHYTDSFVRNDDSACEDVRKILADVRQQYDRANSDAEKKAFDLAQLREEIRVCDLANTQKQEEQHRLDESQNLIMRQYLDAKKKHKDVLTDRKVLQHMLKRILHEQAILKEKMLKMQEHLDRKKAELDRMVEQHRMRHSEKVQSCIDLELMDQDAANEQAVCEEASKAMMQTLDMKRQAIRRRADFERWRHEVALEAANEAFHASAGRLRKLYAVEKLAGNCLQKITFEQVERSQTTEDGFQKIREVTGLTDVMDIVHKFLNRDVEHEQLKGSVKEAEERLLTLREDFDRLKRENDGITFDPEAGQRSRGIYQEVEEHESTLNQALKDHEQSRQRLQRTTLSVENMKRWSNRMSKALSTFDEQMSCARVEKPSDLPGYFRGLHRGIEKFIDSVGKQLSSGKIKRATMKEQTKKEYKKQEDLLHDKEFLKSNCRVPASADGRPPSARQPQAGSDEDPSVLLAADREKFKDESHVKVTEATRKAEAQNKRLKKT